MRGVVALARRGAAPEQVARRPRLRGVDARPQLGGVGFRYQARQRNVDARGIAEERRAVGIGELHRLDHEMHAARIVGRKIRIAFEDVEDLDQDRAAGRRRRHRHDVVAAIAAAQRLPVDRLIGLEIVRRHQAAGGAHGGHDFLRDRALVEGPRSVAGDGGERVGEVALQQGRAGAERPAVVLEENLGRGRPALQARFRARQRIRDVILDREALARETYGGCDQLRQGEFPRAVFGMGEREARDRAGHADRERAVARLLRVGFALVVEEDIARDRGRCGLAIVDRGLQAARSARWITM